MSKFTPDSIYYTLGTFLLQLHRMYRPEDYQGPIVFLMSKASSYMAGANLIIDGGWTSLVNLKYIKV